MLYGKEASWELLFENMWDPLIRSSEEFGFYITKQRVKNRIIHEVWVNDQNYQEFSKLFSFPLSANKFLKSTQMVLSVVCI